MRRIGLGYQPVKISMDEDRSLSNTHWVFPINLPRRNFYTGSLGIVKQFIGDFWFYQKSL